MKRIALILFGFFISITISSQSKPRKKLRLSPCQKARAEQKMQRKNQPTTAVLDSENLLFLKENQTVFLEKEQMNISFLKVTEDSRCPENARCMWSGVATVEVEVMSVHSRPMLLKISDIEDKTKGYSKMQQFNGYQISLEKITPNRVAGQEINLKGKYEIGLKIVKTQ